MNTSTKIGFADAVREAVANNSDDWVSAGWRVVRRTEPFSVRGDRARALWRGSDPLTSDYSEYINMRIARETIERTVAETAKKLRMEQRGGVAA